MPDTARMDSGSSQPGSTRSSSVRRGSAPRNDERRGNFLAAGEHDPGRTAVAQDDALDRCAAANRDARQVAQHLNDIRARGAEHAGRTADVTMEQCERGPARARPLVQVQHAAGAEHALQRVALEQSSRKSAIDIGSKRSRSVILRRPSAGRAGRAKRAAGSHPRRRRADQAAGRVQRSSTRARRAMCAQNSGHRPASRALTRRIDSIDRAGSCHSSRRRRRKRCSRPRVEALDFQARPASPGRARFPRVQPAVVSGSAPCSSSTRTVRLRERACAPRRARPHCADDDDRRAHARAFRISSAASRPAAPITPRPDGCPSRTARAVIGVRYFAIPAPAAERTSAAARARRGRCCLGDADHALDVRRRDDLPVQDDRLQVRRVLGERVDHRVANASRFTSSTLHSGGRARIARRST